jgi:hypothetical protein
VATLGCVLIAGQAVGDALIVTKTMTASTVAEIYIQKGSIRVELEIRPVDGVFKVTGLDLLAEERLG